MNLSVPAKWQNGKTKPKEQKKKNNKNQNGKSNGRLFDSNTRLTQNSNIQAEI